MNKDKTKFFLVEALLSLLERKPYEQLTIQEIAKEAYVSRTSFYNHFSSKEEIITFHLTHLSRPVFAHYKEVGFSFKKYLCAYIEMMYKNRTFFDFVRENQLTALVLKELQSQSEQHALFTTTDSANGTSASFIAYETALTFLSIDWFLDHVAEPDVAAVTEIIYQTRKIGYGKTTTSPQKSWEPLLIQAAEKEHPSARKTKQRLYQSLDELLIDTPPAEISVTRLCKQAQAARCSFYRHFSGTEDLIQQRISEIYKEAILSIPSTGRLIGYGSVLDVCFQHYQKHQQFFCALGKWRYELVALRTYSSVYPVLEKHLPYIHQYIPIRPYARDYYHWFIAIQHILPVMMYYAGELSFEQESFASFGCGVHAFRYRPFEQEEVSASSYEAVMV